MKRDIYHKLELWKTSKRRKPLIINGARQTGKTYALKHFGHSSYESVAYMNFEKEEKLCDFFEDTLDPKELIKTLSIHTNVEINPGSTLIIFDEIQECPKALNSLKYFCEEAPEYHVVSAGSLLGVKIAQEKGFPVGKVNFLQLYPLTFFEFLSALEENKLRAMLEECQEAKPFPTPIHEKLISLLKLYLFIGGMPEAVYEYTKSESLKVVRKVQQEILDAYERDFAKHAPTNEIMKLNTIWGEVHRQLAKENKKFIFSAIRKSARGRDYEEAIQWLIHAGLILKSTLVKSPKFPLSAYANSNIFKIFLFDVGLLGAQSNLSPQVVIDGNQLFTEFKGALTENFVAQELTANQNCHLYYWASEGIAEVDFLLESEHEIYPLEVKSGESQKKKSLIVYTKRYTPSLAYRTSTLNLKKDGAISNLPLYLVSDSHKF